MKGWPARHAAAPGTQAERSQEQASRCRSLSLESLPAQSASRARFLSCRMDEQGLPGQPKRGWDVKHYTKWTGLGARGPRRAPRPLSHSVLSKSDPQALGGCHWAHPHCMQVWLLCPKQGAQTHRGPACPWGPQHLSTDPALLAGRSCPRPGVTSSPSALYFLLCLYSSVCCWGICFHLSRGRGKVEQ